MVIIILAKNCYVIMDCYDSFKAFKNLIYLHLVSILAAFGSHWHVQIAISATSRGCVKSRFQTGFVVESVGKKSLVGIKLGEDSCSTQFVCDFFQAWGFVIFPHDCFVQVLWIQTDTQITIGLDRICHQIDPLCWSVTGAMIPCSTIRSNSFSIFS